MHDADKARPPFGGFLRFGQTPALLVVDVVRAYLDPECPLYLGGEEAFRANRQLIAAARGSNVPVIFTKVAYSPGGAEGGQFFRKVPELRFFEWGSEFGEFPESIRPAKGELIITKHYPSAFFGTSLAPLLRTWGVDTVVVTGFSTSGCVRATALDALCHGFAPFVVRDACADRDRRTQDQNLLDIQAKVGEVIALAEAIDQFRQR